ncbi:MAG TPA: RNA methyltransferase [Afifellaceae bacterium]|nr:RNA methyltransferase [Afifellaceae bacterium]
MTERRVGTYRKITSVSNPLVKEIRGLHLKKNRDAGRLFLAEGQKLVRDALAAGWSIETLIYGAQSADDEAVGTLAARTKASGGMVMEVTRQILEKISRRDNPQAVLGVFAQRLTKLADAGQEGLWLALDRVRDPGNLGTIIRTCDGAGVKGVVLVGETCDPFALETVRATMGSLFHVPMARAGEAEFLAHMRSAPARLVGTHLHAQADYRGADYRRPLVLVMGNEQQGLTDALSQACDLSVRIPMVGEADSLNLAVSTGLMIYEALRDELPAAV